MQSSQLLNIFDVSIQLVFPASGKGNLSGGQAAVRKCFHSISFPSEWESLYPSPHCQDGQSTGFHSISFPSEWESQSEQLVQVNSLVSIQLVFPASGKARSQSSHLSIAKGSRRHVSIQLVFPASGKAQLMLLVLVDEGTFPFN